MAFYTPRPSLTIAVDNGSIRHIKYDGTVCDRSRSQHRTPSTSIGCLHPSSPSANMLRVSDDKARETRIEKRCDKRCITSFSCCCRQRRRRRDRTIADHRSPWCGDRWFRNASANLGCDRTRRADGTVTATDEGDRRFNPRRYLSFRRSGRTDDCYSRSKDRGRCSGQWRDSERQCLYRQYYT